MDVWRRAAGEPSSRSHRSPRRGAPAPRVPLGTHELDEGFPERSRDPVIHAVYLRTVPFQHDLHEFRATGRFAMEGPEREALDRCVLFLQTDLPYEWPTLLADGLLGLCKRVLRWRTQRGDRSVWPFFRRSDLPPPPRSARAS